MSSDCFLSAQPPSDATNLTPSAQPPKEQEANGPTTIDEFCAFVQQARFEKIAHLVRKKQEHKKTSTLYVYKIICENYDDEYNDILFTTHTKKLL